MSDFAHFLGHGEPHLLQHHLRQVWAEAGPPPDAHLQAVPPLLQLAGHRPSPLRMPVRAQAGIPGGELHPQGAKERREKTLHISHKNKIDFIFVHRAELENLLYYL